jgi:hypothetical protein
MAREYLCQFGNCEVASEKLPILITVNGPVDTERVRFCSMRHAAEWCFHQANVLAAITRAQNAEPLPQMTDDQRTRMAEWVRDNIDPDDLPAA